jgi:Fic family protein
MKYNAQIDLCDPVLAALQAKIEMLRDMLSKAPLSNQLNDELNRIQIIHQVRGTTGIEGNTLTEDAIEEVIRENSPQNPEEQETLNAYDALKAITTGKIGFSDCCVTEDMVKSLHAILTKKLNQNENVPGQYRLHPIKVGRNFEGERFEQIPAQMKAFVAYINSDEVKMLGELIRAVLAHFYLVTIHPFSDGNGRTSRMLEDCILYHSKYNIAGFFSLSNYYYKHRDAYFQSLDEARFKYGGKLQEFVKFSLAGFCEEMQASLDRVMEEYTKIHFANRIQEMVETKEISKRQHALVHYMIQTGQSMNENAAMKRTDPVIKSIYGAVKSDRTIRRDLDHLKKTRLLAVKNKELSVNYDGMKHFTDIQPDALFLLK